MCGIVGALQTGITADAWQTRLQRMTDSLRHRGPDDSGIWFDTDAGIGLGHRRLSIIDLSPAGHQPMWSADRRYVIVYNGEIYNYLVLRDELEQCGHVFRSRSDTEVMLTAFSRWGVEGAVRRFNGMFAFALWDRRERTLHLARDRMGEKPLYYGWTGKSFLWGSELKALRLHPAFDAGIDRFSLGLYLRYAYITAPHCIYTNIYKLPAGCILTVPAGSTSRPDPVPYWTVKDAALQGLADGSVKQERDVVDGLDQLLQESVGLRMIADVPVGAFLSGGIDSSLVVALMQRHSDRSVKTFSIGFHEREYDEANYARAVARHLGTDHTELYVTSSEALAVVPRIPELYDEPFADSSQIPTFLISQLTRRQVTVSLSGDGGDELFGGYTHYLSRPKIWNRVERLPPWFRISAGRALRAIPVTGWNRILTRMPFMRKSGTYPDAWGEKIHRLGDVLTAAEFDTACQVIGSYWRRPEDIMRGDNGPDAFPDARPRAPEIIDPFHRMMYLDMTHYLPEDILTKVDRASMAVSLETRIPLLDHRVVEFAWRTPLSMKIRNEQGKWLLRQVLYRYVPERLVERPKMGFGVPVEKWLRGPLRDWAENLLAAHRLREDDLFDPTPIRDRWQAHLSGRADWSWPLWAVLMFQAWKERWA